MTYTLFGFPPSGNTHKIRMLMNFLNIECDEVNINLKNGEHKQAAFLAINPRGQVPALQTSEGLIIDSHAILVYLASLHGKGKWWPESPLEQARLMEWISFSANEIHSGMASLRKHHRLGIPIAFEHALQVTENSMRLLDKHLSMNYWLVGTEFSLADLCCLPYLALAHEAQFDLTPFPNVQAWIARCKQVPGITLMPGMQAPA
ncbi:MAG: glutathione S-transferase family protein [Burkholderiales bacterium]|nr:glutathione S-transferase family protein [Burkholderiales bacterium]